MTEQAKRKRSWPQIPILGLAFLMVLAAKLAGWTDISWWWVTFPMWGVPVAGVVAVVVLLVLAAVVTMAVLLVVTLLDALRALRNAWRDA